ncbi:hypothetical protein REPUB_Repub02eG0053200 [Reevesia pubescens]
MEANSEREKNILKGTAYSLPSPSHFDSGLDDSISENVKTVFDAAVKVALSPPKPKRKPRKRISCAGAVEFIICHEEVSIAFAEEKKIDEVTPEQKEEAEKYGLAVYPWEEFLQLEEAEKYVDFLILVTSRKSVVTNPSAALNIGSADYPRYKATNMEMIELDTDFGSSFSGVLTDEHGRVQAIWGSFSTQLKFGSCTSEDHQFVRAIPVYAISQVLDKIISGANGLPLLINGVKRPMPRVRILEVELYPSLLSKARSFGLSDDWIQIFITLDDQAVRKNGLILLLYEYLGVVVVKIAANYIRVKELTLESLCKERKQHEPPRYMTINTAIEQLLEVKRKHGGSGEFQQLILS